MYVFVSTNETCILLCIWCFSFNFFPHRVHLRVLGHFPLFVHLFVRLVSCTFCINKWSLYFAMHLWCFSSFFSFAHRVHLRVLGHFPLFVHLLLSKIAISSDRLMEFIDKHDPRSYATKTDQRKQSWATGSQDTCSYEYCSVFTHKCNCNKRVGPNLNIFLPYF